MGSSITSESSKSDPVFPCTQYALAPTKNDAAIPFAIDELEQKFNRITVVCDHKSVVSEAKRKAVKKPSPLLERLRALLQVNPSIELEVSESNPAHRILTEYVNSVEQNTVLG